MASCGSSASNIIAKMGATGRSQWFAKGSTEAAPFYFVHYSGGYDETLVKMVNERLGKTHDEL